ncbi:aspartate aminotransferase family protein [Leptolyngbya sp. BL0902]|uniref:pyridoxal phosphate-dependent decarboxylase family protein n=1 Tax=Leptolyngbya sp. BL0902 TaxID=1115757 RepID=UPI0018E7D30D|nr:aminotransferase class I/II-fold pyridoxal phosphate-dependent enzyme [Leptolyngbya sp. BL0902]QQE67003.1 aspartate aminotransferase family protein [Leptolyngbya sp. BL0902]
MVPAGLPVHAFVHPLGQNRDAMVAVMQRVAEDITDYLAVAGQQGPMPLAEGSIYRTIPDQSGSLAELVDGLKEVMAGAMNPAHPSYLGHMDPLPTTVSILGDWVTAALNNNMLSVEMSPLLSRLEPLLMAEIAQMFGLGERSGGLLVSGGTLANLQALTVARNVKLGCLGGGIAGQAAPVMFASDMAHTSIQKAAMVLGLGLEGVILIPSSQGRMDVAALEQAIAQAQAQGQQPFAVVATAGTTVTGNIDPLPAIHQIAQAHDLWFHVDAAYGGALAFSPQHRHRLAGIEVADSVTFNPQKWLYVTKTCASVLFREMGLLQSHFRIPAPYMNTDADWVNLGEISVQGTRHPDVLKLWLSLQHLGKAGCAALVDHGYHLAALMVDHIHQRPYLALATEPEMNVLCFRGCPPDQPEDTWDAWNTGLQHFLLTEAEVFLSLPLWQGQRWLKAVLLNPFTTPDHIVALFDAIDRYAAAHGPSLP